MISRCRNGGRTMLAAGTLALLAAAAPTASDDVPLVAAAERQDWRAVHALLAAGADVNTARADGATALHWAAHRDALAAVETLLQAGADVDAANDHGVTPLFLAAENGSAPVAERPAGGRGRRVRDAAGGRRDRAHAGGALRERRHRAHAPRTAARTRTRARSGRGRRP